jgi:RHS repeat-associated protein
MAYAQGPQVASTTPAAGSIGTSVQINGSGFGGARGSSAVSFNGVGAAVTGWSDGQITATVPTAATGAVIVTVGGTSSNANVYFTVPQPLVTSVSPSSGTGGTAITVNGSDFGPSQGSSILRMNGGWPLTVSSWSSTQIKGTVPAPTTTGPVTVIIDGAVSNPDVIFTVPTPNVTGITPSSGPVTTSVQINGSGFGASQATVTINSVALNVLTWSDGQITATMPNTVTTGPVQVTVNGIRSNSNIYFTVPPPQITSISPTNGISGTSVTVNGSGFQATQSSNVVQFNGYAGTVSSWSDTKIVATVSTSAKTGPVTVNVNNVTSNSDIVFKLISPLISGLVPASGPTGTQVQVNGSGFGATQGTSTVSMRGGSASVVSWSDTQIVITIPPTGISGAVTVTVSGVLSNTDVNFTVPGPMVTSVSPASGVAGQQVTINGSGFQPTRGAGSYVYFNNVTATVNSWTDAQIVATVPLGAGTGPVAVYVNGWSNLDQVFTTPDPIVTSVSPSSGPVGTQVQVNGRGFGATQGTSTLTFYYSNATIISWSDTQIVANVPIAATSGFLQVKVGTVASNTDVYFTVPKPQITSISPTSGGVGTQVTVNGSGFQAARGNGYVSFNSLQATVTSWSDTQIVATVASSTTTGLVRLFANNGDSSNLDQVFTMPNPVVSSVSPVSGAAGTTLVTVNGKGFGGSQGSSTLSFNGTNATNIPVSSWMDSQIQATVPSNATSGAVKVTNGGVSSNSNVTFTVGAMTVGSVNPPGGPIGTPVTVTGSGFGTVQGTISFNGTNATSVSTWTDSQIQATVPAGATSGAVKVVAGGVASNTTVSFTVGTVVVNNVSPARGLAGTQFQINGSGFGATQGASTLRFATYYAPTVVTWSDTQITATVPAVAQSGSIVVTVGSVASNSNVNFTVVAPLITSVSPSSGPVGTQVQINGSGFGTTQGGSSVGFYGGSAPIVSWSDSQVVVTVPTSAVTGLVTATVNGLVSNQTIYFTVPGPQITSISPASGVVGTQVTVTGTGFHSTQGNGGVAFYHSGNPAAIVSWSDTQIVATVPTTATTGPVTVTASGATSNQNVLFTMPSPQITSVAPSSGTFGTQVQVNGSGFGTTQGTSALTFYSYANANIISWSDTQITATVPTGAMSGSINVTEGGVSSNTNINFTVPAPRVTSVSPATGPVGTQVTVTGSGFLASRGSSNVVFGNGYAQTVSSWSDTQIVATVPSTATTGGLSVAVDGVWSNSDVMFTLPNPQITGLVPSSGPVGTQVQVNGSGFGPSQGSSTITFTGVSPMITSWSDTQIVVTIPATVSTGQVKIVEGGVNSNLNINFTVPPPQVTSLSPGSGVVGTQVTINGSGFQASQGSNSRVTFNGGSAATVVNWSDTQIVAAVPAGTATGPVRVFVNNVSSNQDVDFTLPNPQITSVSPSTGPVGTQVQVNGSGFGAAQGASTLAFTASVSNNGPAVASIVSWSDTQIVVTVPSVGATGPVIVSEGGVPSNSNIDFTVPTPQITSITPNIGGGGNPVTITGSGFQASPGAQGKIPFYGGNATITSWSDTQIQAIVPGTAATGPVQVVASNGEGSNYINYTVPNLMVTRLSPGQGPVGTSVTITGTGFGASQGTSTVTFKDQPAASISSWSDTQILATVPVTFTAGPIRVTVNNINSNNTLVFTVPGPWVVAPSAPQGGLPGTQVRFNGSGFQANQRDSTVTFNGVVAPIVSWSDTTITATVPIGATTGPLVVTVNGVTGQDPVPFEVPNPVISSLSRSPVPVGGQFTINGSGFGPNSGYQDGDSALLVNGVSNIGIISWSDTQIVAQASPFAQSGNLSVRIYGAMSNAVPITVEGAPTVTSIDPPQAEAGTTVTLTGTGFGPQQNNGQVVFYGGATAVVTSWSDTVIMAVVPDGTQSGGVGVFTDNVGGPTAHFIFTKTTHVTDSLGNTSAYTSEMYFGTWLALKSTGSGCSTCTIPGNVSNTFDQGILIASTDELGHVTSYTYDPAMNVASTTQQLDSTTPVITSYTYNTFGEPLTVTDPLGNVTTNTYDGNGNLLSVTAPAPDSHTTASVTQFAYDTKGELTQITDPLGNLTKLAYNAVGLISTITDAQQNVTTYAYDQHGNRTSVTDALSNQTTFAYDAGDRLTKITYPDQTFVSFAYDSRGRRTSVTDQNGKTTSYAYDDADRLTSVTDAASNVTQYAYDTENNLLSITDAAGHATSFTYDAFRRVTQTTFPSTLTESYIYDSASNLTNKTDRNGHSILYVYDALNRLTHKGYPDSTGVDYLYDLAGKIKQVTDPTGTYAMAYDNMGRLIGTTTTYSFLPGVPLTNSYVYDANSNRKMLFLPDGSSDTYSYDTLNRLSTITDSLTGVFNFGYDGLSRRTSLTRPNGVNTGYGYDSVSHLLSVLHQAGTNTLDGATYSYDNAGNRTAKTNKLNNVTEQYTYDPLYQLTQVVQGATTTESYSYDLVGNRLASLGVPSYTTNSSNELTANSAASFTYDNNGNTLSKTDPTGTRTYAWDFENRLASVLLPGTGGTVIFKYDPFGRRIQKAFTQNSTNTVTNYVYDGANTIEEVDVSGNELARYAQGVGIDEPLAELRLGAAGYYEQDGLGSVTSLSGATGALSNSYAYDAFGTLTASTGSLANPFQYTGRDFDSETGLRYYRARYYDSTTGRFLSEDPADFDGGINFYGYAANNPIAFIDPSGLDATVTQNGTDVTVTANIVLHSSTQLMATFYNQAIDYFWNRNGNYFHYGKCTLKFKIKVVLARAPRPKPPVNDVYLKYSPNYMHSHVTNHNRGVWWAGATAWIIAHETAHFLDLPDEYTLNPDGTSSPKPGWDNDILATPDSGVTQKDLELLLKGKGCKCK